MSGKRTFTMIKPDAVGAGHSGTIMKMIEQAGYRIVAMKLTRLSEQKARKFYAVHEGKPFYEGLVAFMTSGNIIAMILEKDNAVLDYRKFIGSTDPTKAEDGTVRKLFATSGMYNAVHGSDSDENAQIEGSFFFSYLEEY